MHKPFLLIGGISGAMAVILGAFGAHSLKKLLTPEALSAFETGVRYQFYHTFALLFIALLYERFPNKWIARAGYFFITGIVLFSGSLYLLTTFNATHSVGLTGIGILTPIGGLFFIAGWIFMIIGATATRRV